MAQESGIAVVTGASAGIGRATAVAFGRRGWRVGLIARSRPGLRAACAEVEAAGGRALALPADVADADAVEAAAAAAERSLGPIGVWVNNAMATIFAPVARIAPHEFRRATEVTYLGAVYGTMAALRRMRRRDAGVVVQVGSALAYRSIPLQAPYCGAKAALRGFTDSLRSELLHDASRVRLTMVHLPAVNTPQFEWALSRMPRHPRPVPPIFQPEMAAEAIVWAALHPRREVFVGGPTLLAVWANAFAPGLLDRYLAATNYQAQQMEEPTRPDRPSNLFDTPADWHRTRGRFPARDRSLQLWATTHGGLLAATGIAVLGAAALAWGAQ